MTLTPDLARKLAAIFKRLDSPFEGEAVAALTALRRQLPEGMTIGDLAERGGGNLSRDFAIYAPKKPDRGPISQPMPSIVLTWWGTKARECIRSGASWNETEQDFLYRMVVARSAPSVKQEAWLRRLHAARKVAA